MRTLRPRLGPAPGLLFLLAACAGPSPPPEPAARPPSTAPSLVTGADTPAAEPPAEAVPGAVQELPSEPRDEEPAGGEPDPAAPDSPGRGILGWVAGRPLTVSDLLGEWHDLAGRDLWLLVDRVVASRLAFAEADRLALRLAPEVVEARLTRERGRLFRELGVDERGLSLEEFVRQELGRDPGEYFSSLRRATLRQMIAERAVRAWVLSSGSAAARLIVVAGREEADRLLGEIEGGADFAELARGTSQDDTAASGGLVPYLVKDERSPLARLAFATEVGAVAGPIPASGRYVLLLVEEKRAPREGPWSEVEEAVETSLAEHPVAESEFLSWKLAMERRYPIDLEALERVLDRRE